MEEKVPTLKNVQSHQQRTSLIQHLSVEESWQNCGLNIGKLHFEIVKLKQSFLLHRCNGDASVSVIIGEVPKPIIAIDDIPNQPGNKNEKEQSNWFDNKIFNIKSHFSSEKHKHNTNNNKGPIALHRTKRHGCVIAARAACSFWLPFSRRHKCVCVCVLLA